MNWNTKRIFHLVLHATTTFMLGETFCGDHDYTVDGETFNWPPAPSSEVWIPTNCLNDKYQLIFRKCVADEWVPDNTEFQSSCTRKMNKADFNVCPPYYSFDIKGPTIETFCYEILPDIPDGYCDVGHISFTDLNTDEKQLLLEHMYSFFGSQWSLAHGDSIHWWFSEIFTLMDYKNGEVRLQNSKCGSFGLPFNVNTKTVTVHCPTIECSEMCLSLNITKDLITEPPSASGVVTVEKCGAFVVNIFRPLMAQYQCPLGYYRMEFSYRISAPHPRDACYSIQMFDLSIPVQEVETKAIIETYCKGKIMQMTDEYNMFLFMEMSREIGLNDGHHCLFGLTTNNLVKYSDWDEIDLTYIAFNNFKWDESMNYSVLSNDSYLAVNSEGLWTWATVTVSCVVCMFENHLFEYPTLSLTYDFLGKEIELEVTDQDNLFREESSDHGFICFALINQTYVSNLTVYPVAESNYLITNVGDGRYWCFGHTIFTDLLVSNIYDVYGMVFVFVVVRKCRYPCSFSEYDSRDLNKVLEQSYNFVKILNSAVVLNGTIESDTEYHFVAHVRLVLNADAIVNLDTNLISPLTQRQLETVFLYERMNEVWVNDEAYGLEIESITSTEYCLHETTLSLGAIIWRVSNINETIPTSSLCKRRDIQIKTRTCSADTVYGSYWKDLVNDPLCYSNVSKSLLELYIRFNDTHQDLEDLNTILQDNIQTLLPIDVFLTSRIVVKVSTLSMLGFELVSSIFNSIMQVDEQILNIAASLNSTNILLDFLDRILLSGYRNSQFTDGTVAIQSPLIETYVLCPFVGGVSGVALYRPQNLRHFDANFTNYSTRYIYPNESIEDVFSNWETNGDLVVGSYLPADLLNSLRNITVAIVIFFNDKLFQSNSDTAQGKTLFKTNGKVVSITIFENDLPGKVPIFFEANKVDSSTCGYWSLISDVWSSKGCTLRQVNDFNHLALCECTHLTHFGYLVDSYRHEITEKNERALTSITIIGSSISLFGSFGIFVTATTFPNWRQKLSSQTLIHFSASIALQMCLMIVSNVDAIANNVIACVAMGSLQHYSILVMHFWMLIIGYFQFRRYVVVFDSVVSHTLVKSTIFGWVVPLAPVIVVLATNYSLYLPTDNDEIKFCYPTRWALHYGVWAPIGLIFLVNTIVYLRVVVSLNKEVSNSACTSAVAKHRRRLSQMRLFVFLFFALGLTWIFGFLSNVLPSCYLTFTYLFCITSTVQGLVLFFYFIILDPYVRHLWLRYFKNIIDNQ